ncbi:MAG: PASTA domain-containing protein [Christensenellales bacterium]
MSDNNDFLSNYGKGGVQGDTGAQVSVDAPKTYKYEQKSGFKKPETKTAYADTKKGKPIIGLAVGGAVIAVIVILLIILLPGGGVALPDFSNMTLTQAQLWARENNVLLNSESEYSDEVAAERIISQDKEPATRIGRGDFVRVTVSLGPDLSITLPLPDLMSLTSRQIEAWAQENFMTRVRITAEFSDTVPAGNVIRFEVNDETAVDVVRRDSPVYIIISKGPESEAATVTVPDFKTMSVAESYAFAAENGITLTMIEEYDDYIPAGMIISQSVKAQEKISKGSEIIIVMSKGKMITVPGFKGYSQENAVSLAASLGISVSVTERYSSSSAGVFISQSISAGTVYNSGDILVLTYSLSKEVFVPSFVGQSVDAIKLWAQELNKMGANIKIDDKETTYSGAPIGTILYQDKTNKSVGIKETIKITVSKGRVVYVPVLTGKTIEEAIEECELIGLIPIFIKESSDGIDQGIIWKQSITPGTEESEGTKITLHYQP